MPDNIQQKHITDCTCFNYKKPGYIAKNCKSNKNQQRKEQKGRIQLTATSRRGYNTTKTRKSYNKPIQMFATLYKEPSFKTLKETEILNNIVQEQPAQRRPFSTKSVTPSKVTYICI
jgi:hypothetical protein